MKYLEGSSFTVHVGGSAYAEGWDRIFRRQAPEAPTTEALVLPAGCFGCERIHASEQKCYCVCHSLET